jgi:hypothetical protein
MCEAATLTDEARAFVDAMLDKMGSALCMPARYAEGVRCRICEDFVICLSCQPPLDVEQYREGVCRLSEEEQTRLCDILERYGQP